MFLSETLSLMLIAVAVAVMPGLSRLIRLPNAVTEILLGIILGKSFLHLQLGGDWLPFLAHLGFLVLMFQAGMEIDFAMLRNQSLGELLFQLFIFLTTFGLSYAFSTWMGQGVFLALVLSTTSLGLVMPTLRESGLSKKPIGQSILIASTLADFLTLLGITFFILGKQYGLTWKFVLPLPLFAGFVILLLLVRLWAWWNPNQVQRFLGQQDNQELGVRFSLALLFLFVALSELVHLEPVLGAFMGGCVLSFVFKEKGFLEGKLSALGFGFLIPIFFIDVGMRFDLKSVLGLEQFLFALKLLGLAVAVKVLPSLLLLFRGVTLKKAFKTGVLLSTRLSLIVAAASIGVKEGLLTVSMKDSIILLAVLTCLLGPTGFKILHRLDDSPEPKPEPRKKAPDQGGKPGL